MPLILPSYNPCISVIVFLISFAIMILILVLNSSQFLPVCYLPKTEQEENAEDNTIID